MTAQVGNPISDDVAVGLSDPSNARNRKEMLELVNRLRDTGVQTDIDLPMIAVIGNQSAGKSSLIESISGVTLPRSSGTCTRCPTECKLSHSDAPWSCDVKLHFHTDSDGSSIPVRRVPFGGPITSQSLVEDRIRRAQRAILNPSRDCKMYLDQDNLPEENELSFSKNYVSLEISGDELADLSFVDLPGLIASAGAGGNDRDIELIRSLVTSYIKKPSCVILLTVACETDFENQGAHHLAKSFDQQGKRTVGVLTKPDRIPEGEEHRWLKLVRNETEPLVNNWYCVKQPSSQDLSDGITWKEARDKEHEYFAETKPWNSLESQHRSCLRTKNLTERLSLILSELVAKRLPEIQEELVKSIRETEEQIKDLPRAPSSDALGEVLQALNGFSRELSRRVEGTPDKDGLLQSIRPHQKAFRRAILGTAPNFIPFEKNKPRKRPHKPKFLEGEEMEDSEEGDSEEEQYTQAPPAKKRRLDENSEEEQDTQGPPAKKRRLDEKIYIDDVLQRAESACTRELPDNYPFVVQQTYIKEFMTKWRHPTMELFDRVYGILKADAEHLVEQHFAHMGKGTAKQPILVIINDHLDKAATRTKIGIEWLLSLEQAPTTLNTHYFSDYKDKFLAHYKAQRNDSDVPSKPKVSVNSNARASWQGKSNTDKVDRDQLVNRALSALSEIGFSVKPEDLTKLLPSDPMEPALNIMASVRAYFQVAYKRFADIIPMAIDHEIVMGLERGLDEALREGLQITGPDGRDRCKNMVEELSTIATARQELQKKMERLQAARRELKMLM